MKKLITLIILIIMMLTGQAVTNESKQVTIPDVTGETAAVCEATTANTTTNETITIEPQNAPCATSEPDETETDYITADKPNEKASETTLVNIKPEITTEVETNKPETVITSELEIIPSEPAPTMDETTTEEHGEVSEPVSETDTEANTEPSPHPCADNGDNNIAPYTPADCCGTPNPFANPAPNEATEIDAEDLVQLGDDRAGEGIHF